MFRNLTEKEVQSLEPGEDEVLLTLVGDGEYRFNVPGNVFKDIGTMLSAVKAATTEGNGIFLVTSTDNYTTQLLSSRDDSIPFEPWMVFVGRVGERYISMLALVRKVSTTPAKADLGG